MQRRFIPYSLLAACLALTAVAVYNAHRTGTAADRYRFERIAERLRAALDSRLDAYVAMLLGGAGLFAASDDVNWAEFKAYVDRLELQKRYPGVQGIGFSRLVPDGERQRIERTIRRDAPWFEYRGGSAEGPGQHHAIIYLEPQDARNRVALGFDMYGEPTRREAMARARDSALPAATGRVRLVQEIDPDSEQAGFLIYVPVYHGGLVPQSLEERRARLLGFVYSPFRASDFLRAVQQSHNLGELTFEVFDGHPRERRWLHEREATAPAARFTTEMPIEIGGRLWTVVAYSGREVARTSGRAFPVLVGVVGLLLSGLLFSVTTTLVSARHLAEQRAEASRRSEEALRDANRAKDEFLAIVSHELRTPLNAIVGWASMLRRGQVSPENQAHAIEIIQRNAATQTRLIEDLLDLSRAVAGRLRLEFDDVDVAGTLATAVDAVRPSAAQRGVDVEVRANGHLGTVRADPARVQQVVLNVLANAIKFTPAGGRVSVAARRGSGGVEIAVTDTGIGIAPDVLPYVFDRFRQGDSSSTRAHGGIGLGLAISRHIAELHGGTIEAASAGAGRGSTFTIRLPASPPAN